MKSAATLSISKQRLARLTVWAGLWLQAFAAVLITLSAPNKRAARRELMRMARIVGYLVTLHAVLRMRPLRPRGAGRRPVRRNGMRRIGIGAALRRRLRGRDLIGMFFAVLTVMRDLDTLAARQAKRLARGFTRLDAIPPAHEFACLAEIASALDVVSADSS